MNQKEYFEYKRKHFKGDPKKIITAESVKHIKERFVKKAQHTITGDDILLIKSLEEEQKRIDNIPEQENTHTIQDVFNRKRKQRKQPLFEKPKKFLKKKVKKDELVFAEIKREATKIREPKILIQHQTDLQEVLNRHIKYANKHTPKMRVVKHANPSFWFNKKKPKKKT